jgi:hypothetical protein
MTQESFHAEVSNLIEDYLHNNNESPTCLLLNMETFHSLLENSKMSFWGLEIILSDDLVDEELVVC